jgi:vacuolar-type H+-ATPase subunit H
VDIDPEKLQLAEFDSLDDGGFDPEQVRETLRKAAERIRELERDGVRSVGDSVNAVLELATKTGEELVDKANSDADAIRAAAETDSGRIADDAAEVAAKHIADGEKLAAEKVEAAQGQVDKIVTDAETEARDRATTVINDAQRRLDDLLAAERNVHDRLQAAMTDIQASLTRVGVDQAAELLLTVEEPTELEGASWADDNGGDGDSSNGKSESNRKSA